MTEPVPDVSQNLSGVWNGLYTYADGASVSFVATLVEIGGTLSGTTEEPCTAGGSPSDIMVARLRGSRQDRAVHFVKTYDGANPYYAFPVAYEGTLDGDATEIEGRWVLPAVGAGTFLMIRAGGKRATVARKAVVRV